jgi:prophage maintenance system killer protein
MTTFNFNNTYYSGLMTHSSAWFNKSRDEKIDQCSETVEDRSIPTLSQDSCDKESKEAVVRQQNDQEEVEKNKELLSKTQTPFDSLCARISRAQIKRSATDKQETTKVYSVDKSKFKKVLEQSKSLLDEERRVHEKDVKEKGASLPSREILTKIELLKHPNYLSSVKNMPSDKKNRFQAQRMSLSKTNVRHPHEKQKWQKADEEISRLVQGNNKIKITDIENLQKILNQFVLYLNIDNSDKKHELEDYIHWLNVQLDRCQSGEANPIVVAAQAYQYFLHMHPFQDGNGRIGRFMMDLILQRSSLPPANLACSVVPEEVDALVFDVENNIDSLVLAIRKGMVDFCEITNQAPPFKTLF